jgi:Ethanolamine utilization protein EutJ (predicted chaperonin)
LAKLQAKLGIAAKNAKGANESKLQAGLKLTILALVFFVLNKDNKLAANNLDGIRDGTYYLRGVK